MNHILIQIQRPDRTDAYKYSAWVDALGTIEKLTTQNKDFESLAQGILLIPLRNGLGVLPQIFQALTGVQYRYRVFDGEPEWHEGPMDFDTQNQETT